MKDNWLERTELLLSEKGVEKLKKSKVLIVGLGGVGSFAAEFIARSGVGNMVIVDGDDIDNTNINRQLPALKSTVGKQKVDVVADRLLDINPELNLKKVNQFINPEMAEDLVNDNYDYIMDCIDSVSPKIYLIVAAKRAKKKIISSMGAGGKMDPSKVVIKDISKTNSCFLARTLRKRLKKHGITGSVKSVFSTEIQDVNSLKLTDGSNYKKSFYGTNSYMPALFGLHSASYVIQYLLKKD